MGPLELLRWQWQGYAGYHRNRFNLVLHIVVVPMFWLGTIWLIMGVVSGSLAALITGAVYLFVSLLVQGKGHKLELTPPAPFTSPWNFIGRLLFEQFITFPRFVLSGGWSRNLAANDGDAA